MAERMTTQQAADRRPDSSPPSERSVAQLFADLSAELHRLVRDEMRLATAELQRKGKRAGLGAGVVGVAGITAVLGAGALVAAAILALALVLPGWAAALIVGGALLVVAGLFGGFGALQVKHSSPPVPEEAIEGVGKDVEAAKEAAGR